MALFYTPTNVEVGIAALYLAPYNPTTPVTPTTPYPGFGNQWTTPWFSPGGTDQGYTMSASGNTNEIHIEEQAASLGTFKTDSSVQITGALAEGSPTNLALYMGGVVTSAAAVNEVQTITISGTPTGGTFTVTLDGVTSGNIAYNAAAAAVQTAITAMSNVGTGNAVVTGGPGPGTPYVVTFQGTLAGENIAQMTATGAFTGGSSPAVAVTTTTAGVSAEDITLSENVLFYVAALEWQITNTGQTRRLFIPQATVTGTGDVAFRRAADKRMYGIQVTSACATSLITINKISADA